jgi:predicted permease
MENLLQDLRYGIRVLLKSPGVSLMAILALALGIGANTAIFSVVNAVLLRALPYKNPDRILMVWVNNRRAGVDQDYHSYPNYEDYNNQNHVFEQIAAFIDTSSNITGDGEPERVIGAATTINFFPVMGMEPAMGRMFLPEEWEEGHNQVAVLSHGLWQRRFGSDPQIVGKTISINGKVRTIVGVMPPAFRFPAKETEVWVPLPLRPDLKGSRTSFWLKAVGRLKPGVTLDEARSEMEVISNRLVEQYPSNAGYGVNLVPLYEQFTGNIRSAILVLFGAVAFVLLIACANVANLLLARGAARGKEIAIRAALGAGRTRLIRQFLTESVLLAFFGGLGGLLIAFWGIKVLVALGPRDIPQLDQITIDGKVLGFTLAVSLLTGLIFGLVPALQASRPDLNETLKEGGRSSAGGFGVDRVRRVLIVSEIALSLVLLIGAGLLIKSFIRLQDVNLGFNPDHLLTMNLQLAGSNYKEDSRVSSFYKQLIQRVEALPGVQSAAAVSDVFLNKVTNSSTFSIEGRPNPPTAERVEITIDTATPDYFRLMGIPLVRGREFDEHDTGDIPVVIINETMAKRFWPNEDPVGKRIVYGDPDSDTKWITVVGVVGDMRRTGVDTEVRCETFVPHNQWPLRSMVLVVRTASDPLSLAGLVRQEVLAIDKDQPVYNIKTVDQLLSERVSQRRFNMLLLGIFATIALLLAGVGIYGVMSFIVTQRTREIGIRMALGAQKGDVIRLVVGQGIITALAGVLIGLAAAFALTRLMSSLLFGVSTTDPVIFVIISLLLTAVAGVACYIPALRATRVDPMVALRYE